MNENILNSKVLILDDNSENLNVLYNYLHKIGYKVYVMQDPINAVKQIPDIMPDLILLDIMMPEMDGFEVCKILKSKDKTKSIPIIFITALTETADKLKGFKLGAVDYITKPFEYGEVSARIRTHLTILKQSQKLNELNDALQKSNEAKDQLFSIISHDLKTPFSGFLGLVKLMIEDFENMESDDMKLNLESIHSAAKRLYALLENLLEWSRLQAGKINFNPENVNLFDTVNNVLNIYESILQKKRISIKNNIIPSYYLNADSNMLQTILRNLINNAIKYTHKNGLITLDADETENDIQIIISDTGIGMRENRLETLFSIKHKMSAKGTEGEEGTGLGLILTENLIRKHGGTIRAESIYSKGSSFIFNLPKA